MFRAEANKIRREIHKPVPPGRCSSPVDRRLACSGPAKVESCGLRFRRDNSLKSIRMLSPLAILFAATALTTPVAAAPTTGPSRYFTGADLFNLEIATDPQISPDGRTIAY